MLQARSFPYMLLRRDQMHPELIKFKNRDGCLIILVSDNEKIGMDAAKLMVDRGTDNIFLLNGGIAEFAHEYSSYIEGTLPPVATPRTRTQGNITQEMYSSIYV